MKIIQWATGNTGSHAVRAIANRPAYQLTGAFVYSKEKAGRDIGEVCGTRPLGVLATTDRSEIMAAEADCVLYMAFAERGFPEAAGDVCQLLESGKNVIATSTPFLHPKAMDEQLGAAIEGACQAGGVTFHGLGIAPGYMSEMLPLSLSRLWGRVDKLVARETLMYNEYPSHEMMFDFLGFGYEPDDPTPLFTDLEVVGTAYKPSSVLLADTLGLKDYELVHFRDIELAPEDFDVASGHIRKGTVAAMRFGTRVLHEGRAVIVQEHCTRMREDLGSSWPRGDGWSIVVEGEPSMSVSVNIGIHGEDHTDQACLATAMHAVHAIPQVVNAAPGIHTLVDLAPFYGGDAFTVAQPAAVDTK
ncbi:NAD(P)H-dependent amine dehydrogenase family protein [Mycobacterium paraseoulense]|uniref:NAD(P)H-dependent amine dehydrogenase family protein n=1 Tax=Mycobacterium TaxID=1763 RepID=UPI0009F37ACE|nr:hypothetical protein [Mycobacterium paraseoulense]MCV7393979.1 dihydrodipicolinate reductase [Mycobacterium paraseoulense]BBZ70389.1 diacylglycerol kinase [Mycobacterium paraseoulense]